MQRFKSIILPMQGQNKSNLHWLYNTKSDLEPPKIYTYENLLFYFGGTRYRTSEKLLLYIEIPAISERITSHDAVVYENYLLGKISPVINELSRSYINIDKNVREKAQFASQNAGVHVLRRSGMQYDITSKKFILRLNFNMPLVNALSINANAGIRAVKDILLHVKETVEGIDAEKLDQYVTVYHRQQQIRAYLKNYDLCTFVANGSLLPRENGTDMPMKDAVPFISPESMMITIPLDDGTSLSGMGIKRGITVITGGGYSGKSTLLDAIEMGIYNHIPGDGREYVITDDSALKIYAEDGRPVSNLDLSPFFKYLYESVELENFSTLHASGSVSQAANIIEAVCSGSKLLLIDEDKSATNFMIRDRNMRKIVKNEPIIPFTDRVCGLYAEEGVSTILVIGCLSEYLSYADTVILMDNYVAEDITGEIVNLELLTPISHEIGAYWAMHRRLLPRKNDQPFLYFRSVETENEKKIILDEYSADITLLTALISVNQMNTLAYVMEKLLTDKEVNSEELMQKIRNITQKIFSGAMETEPLLPDAAQRFYEEIRSIDAFCCVNHMRGLHFCIQT